MRVDAAARQRLESALTHPVIRTTAEFLKRLDIRISTTAVRERLMAAPGFPKLGLADVQEAFDAWRLPSAAFRTESQHLRTLPLPILAALDQYDEETDTTEHVIVIVTAWTDAGVQVDHPLFGVQNLAWGDFLAAWTGTMFVAGNDAGAGEPDYDSKCAAERSGASAYRRSIELIPSFMTPDECAGIIAACEGDRLFERSPLASLYSGEELKRPSRVRTSSTALLPRWGTGPYDPLYVRAADMIGVDPACFEALQCVRYDPGQRFYPHIDGMGRTHTLLVYLNDDFEGGKTLFPDIDLMIAPQRGLAALFRNLDDAGAPIPWSRHGGQPPSNGRKYACNIWAHPHPLPER